MAEVAVITEAVQIYRRLHPECNTVVRFGNYSGSADLVVSTHIEQLKDYGGIWDFLGILIYFPQALELLCESERGLGKQLYVRIIDLHPSTRLMAGLICYP